MDTQRCRKTLAALCVLVLAVFVGAACSEVPQTGVAHTPTQPPATSDGQETQQATPTVPVETSTSIPATVPEAASTPVPTVSPVTQPPPVVPASLPNLCKQAGPEVYLVFGAARHHIVDWETFVNLGFTQDQIVPCGAASGYAEGFPITRLLKGNGDPVYWMEGGHRRHIPDMDTFHQMGYREADITVVPDDVLAQWPLGEPLPSVNPTYYLETTIGAYTIRLYHPLPGQGLYDWATISSPGQPDTLVQSVAALGRLPGLNVTGEGEPDVMFETYEGGSHCCEGTVVYNLGSRPTEVLNVRQQDDGASYGGPTGRGTFLDLDSNGSYEFITNDRISDEFRCLSVETILEYEPGRGYVGASPRFPDYFLGDITRHTEMAEAANDENMTGYAYQCNVLMVIVDYLYLGQDEQASEELHRLYLADDADEIEDLLRQAVREGRFYVPPAE